MKWKRKTSSVAFALLGILAALAVGAVARDAHATSPGENGRIAFRRYFNDAHTAGAIFVAKADGTRSQQVTRPPRGFLDDQPDWSPNGSIIVFYRCSATTPCAVYTVRPDGTRLKRLSLPVAKRGHAWSDDANASFTPDGRHIVFTRASGGVRTFPGGDQIKHSDVVVMDLKGKNRRVVLRAPLYQADYEWPMFSPSGSQFVYEHRRSHFVDRQTRRALVVSSADGKHRKRITPWSMNAGDNADWSPDGTRILFRSHEDDDDQTQSQLYTIRPDGTDLKRLTDFPARTVLLSASFSPDGRQIVFGMGGKGGKGDIYVMRADGSDIRPIVQDARWDSAADWGSG